MMLHKQFKHYVKSMTIREFLMSYGDIDCNPVGQRPDIGEPYENSTGTAKAQEIIRSLLSGVHIGVITLHEPTDSIMLFKYESIDGGHRKRYIKAYFENEFRVDGKYYRDLSDEEKEMFLGIDMQFVIYQNLEKWQIGYIFRCINQSSHVNHQEQLNSYGDTPIANAIRETVRVMPHGNKIHSLFEYTMRDGKKNFVNLQFDNRRLRIEELIARLFYRYYDGGGIGDADDKALETLYSADLSQEEVDRITRNVNQCLNFLENISRVRKQYNTLGLSQQEFSLYTRIWLYMEEKFDSFKINDIEQFYLTIAETSAEFFKPYDQQDDFLQELSPFDSSKSRGKHFRDVLGEHRGRERMNAVMMWFLERIDFNKIVTLKDPRRIFPRDWRERKLAEQGFKCAVDGQPLTMENAQGGHIISHTDGGRTTYDNLAMISTEHNRKMGSMSLEQYKELL